MPYTLTMCSYSGHPRGARMTDTLARAQSRRTAAYAALRLAEMECPHWDYDGPGTCADTCCDRLAECERDYQNARAAVARLAASSRGGDT